MGREVSRRCSFALTKCRAPSKSIEMGPTHLVAREHRLEALLHKCSKYVCFQGGGSIGGNVHHGPRCVAKGGPDAALCVHHERVRFFRSSSTCGQRRQSLNLISAVDLISQGPQTSGMLHMANMLKPKTCCADSKWRDPTGGEGSSAAFGGHASYRSKNPRRRQVSDGDRRVVGDLARSGSAVPFSWQLCPTKAGF